MSSRDPSSATEHFNKLIQFRQAAYRRFGNGRDALFELTDAVIQMRHVQSFVELSCAPIFRRKWSSAPEALQDSRPDRQELMKLYLEHQPQGERLLLAGDHTAWQRLWAETLEGRSYQHQPTPIKANRPVTIGHGYSTLAVVPENSGSWALPLLHERITQQKPVEMGCQQLAQVCELMKEKPIVLLDAEYGCATFLANTSEVPADLLIRLRTNLNLEGPTKPYKGLGKRPFHGIPFKFKDPSTWWSPDEVISYTDENFGALDVRIWHGLRFSAALERRMTVARVERLQATDTRRKPKILWFGWIGQEPPAHWWSLYARRYTIDHWYRFIKGRLHWTLPKVSTPEQSQRWSDVMPFITWELWLARAIVDDQPLPWQKRQVNLSPGRVCQSFPNIMTVIGTPTRVCKPRGKAPGWPKGQPRTHHAHQDLIISEQWEGIRARQKAEKEAQKSKKGSPKKEKAP